MKKMIFLFYSCLFLFSCASTTEEGAIGLKRKQFMIVSSSEVNQMALQNFAQVKEEAAKNKTLDTKPALLKRVQAIANHLIPFTAIYRKDAPQWAWEVHVITSNELNAYCMPGGKIVFYSGIIENLKMTDGEIAAVMGHEIAHALREHGRERVSQGLAQQLGLGVLASSGKVSEGAAQLIGQGATLLMTLPHSRNQESEADDMGLELMARAGYNPQEAVSLWQKMAQASGGKKPPEILSTHPSDQKRIQSIQALIPQLKPLYDQSVKK